MDGGVMADRLAYTDSDKRIYVTTEATETTPQVQRTDWQSPMYDRADKAIDGLQLIVKSTGALTLSQLSNAVRLIAQVVIALVRIQLGRREID